VHGLRGSLHLTFEEGTWAAWLYDLLKPHVTKLVVCDPRRNGYGTYVLSHILAIEAGRPFFLDRNNFRILVLDNDTQVPFITPISRSSIC
jgi:hypothetical protein